MGSESIVWIGRHDNVGIRFRVVPAASETMPLISGPDDDPPVHYTMVYEGKSLEARFGFGLG